MTYIRPKYFLYYISTCIFLSGCGGGIGSDTNGDPVLDTIPIAYIERVNLVESNENDQPVFFQKNKQMPSDFFPGSRLMLRKNSSVSSTSEHLFQTRLCDQTSQLSGQFTAFCDDNGQVKPYDVKDLSVSYDGRTLLVAVRAPAPDDDEAAIPTWDIWQYNLDSKVLAPVMSSSTLAAIGQDVAPTFLPDDDIIFASSLQQRTRALLLDEGKSQYQGLDEDRNEHAVVLHRMSSNGDDVKQLSFNLSHDTDPAVLADGRVVFSRWDHMGSVDKVNIYTMKPDGRQVQMQYGAHSHQPLANNDQLEFYRPQLADNGQLLVEYTAAEQTQFGTDLLFVNGAQFTDINVPVYSNLGTHDTGQTRPNGLQGQFASATPFGDGTHRVLAAWSPCRLIKENTFIVCTANDLALYPKAPPLYGLWVFDTQAATQTLIQAGTANRIVIEAVMMAPRPKPPVISSDNTSAGFDAAAAAQGLGVLDIRSVYDIAGQDSSALGMLALADPTRSELADRSGLFLRIVKGVPMPDDDVKDIDTADFGVSRQQLMREIIGYVPIEPDGSVKAAVPAEVPFAISIVDHQGARVGQRHQNWLQLQPGEILSCNGCHQSGTDTSTHGRLDAEPPSANQGATAVAPYPNTNPGLIAQIGETMAQAWSRLNGVPRPSVDVEFTDKWTDPVVKALIDDFAFKHDDLTTPKPLSAACVGLDGAALWSPLCRLQIHYPTHIEPLWSLARQGLAQDGVTLDNQTCNSCHSRTNALGELVVPAAQLELVATASPEQARHTMSYRELLFNDSTVEIRNGALQDVLVQRLDDDGQPIPVLDIDGEPVFDVAGDQVFELTTVGQSRPMSAAGAAASARFFNAMTQAGATVDHRGYLTTAELALLREWLDIGAQYYNDPFATP